MRSEKPKENYLQTKNGGDPIAEIPVLGFVTENMHACQGAYAAAQESQKKQGLLRDAPAALAGTFFVRAHGRKSQNIDSQKIIK